MLLTPCAFVYPTQDKHKLAVDNHGRFTAPVRLTDNTTKKEFSMIVSQVFLKQFASVRWR